MRQMLMAFFMFILLGKPAMGNLFDGVELRGSGCKEGTAQTILSFNGQTLSLLFDEMNAQVPQFDGDNENNEIDFDQRIGQSRFNKNLARKVCNIIIKANIPKGMYLESVYFKGDFRGFTGIEKGAKALFDARMISWEGMARKTQRVKTSIVRKVWRSGEFFEDWGLRGEKVIPIASNCSRGNKRNIKLILKNIIKLQIKDDFINRGVHAEIGLDSGDLMGHLALTPKLAKCKNQVTRPIGKKVSRRRVTRPRRLKRILR